MSFSKEVKKELSKQISNARHCKIAEIAAIICICGKIIQASDRNCYIIVSTENLTVAQKYFILVKKTFQAHMDLSVRSNKGNKKNKNYSVSMKEKNEVEILLKAIKFMDEIGNVLSPQFIVNGVVIQNTCCKRAFLRGAFLTCGSITDPSKAYHFEMVVTTKKKAMGLQNLLQSFGIDAKMILRKKNYVIYVKEGSQIVDVLNIVEAHVALMNLENVRIWKEMRNCVNRQVNCETANIHKTVKAASKQIDDILYIRDSVGYGELSDALEEIAVLRIEYSEASLKELGSLLNPPIGKSGVNHRLRKLSEIAEHLREQKEGKQ